MLASHVRVEDLDDLLFLRGQAVLHSQGTAAARAVSSPPRSLPLWHHGPAQQGLSDRHCGPQPACQASIAGVLATLKRSFRAAMKRIIALLPEARSLPAWRARFFAAFPEKHTSPAATSRWTSRAFAKHAFAYCRYLLQKQWAHQEQSRPVTSCKNRNQRPDLVRVRASHAAEGRFGESAEMHVAVLTSFASTPRA